MRKEWRPTPKRLESFRKEILDRLATLDSDLAVLLREIVGSQNYTPDDWDHGFLQSLSSSAVHGTQLEDLSPKQCAVLDRMLKWASGE